MRNTLKFSLLGTLLCTMSILSSNGYSMENNNDSNLNHLQETDEELVNRINKILNINPQNPLSIMTMYRTHYDEYGNTVVHVGNGYMSGLNESIIIPKAEMNRYNRIKLKKTINTFNINTNPSEIARFAKQLRTKQSREKYSRQAGPASVDFAMEEYPSLNLILNNKIIPNTIENLATKLLQDHLSFISEFSSKNGLKDKVINLFYDAWIRIFVLAAYSSNNPNLPKVLYNLGDACFKHFNIPNFYKN